MIAKEKAKELFDKMYFVDDVMGNYPMCKSTAKQCAIIAVDEIIETLKELDRCGHVDKYNFEDWYNVKKEIDLL